ncbi:MAG: helicase-associated domain-containing protein [Clostridiales bacterium]
MEDNNLYMKIENLTCDDLRKKLRPLGINVNKLKKKELVDECYKYISSKSNIKNVWDDLSKYEKEIVETYIRMNGNIDHDEIDEIKEKHGKSTDRGFFYNWYHIDNLFSDSKTNLLFIKDDMPNNVYNQLKTYVKEVETNFTEVDYKNIDKDLYWEISIKESFENDFIYTLRLINKNKIKVTDKNNYLVKRSFAKMNDVLENKEIEFDDYIVKEIRNFKYTTRLFGIYSLMLTSKLIKIYGDEIKAASKADVFLSSGVIEKCKILFEAYKNSKKINEIERINENRFRYPKSRLNLKSAREVIIKYLKKCPVDKWIDFKELSNIIRINNKNIIKSSIGEIEIYDDYQKYYYSVGNSWDCLESRFIEIALIEYFSTIGIVDVMICDDYSDEDIMYISLGYFKVTNLGGHILGINENYKLEKKEITEEEKLIIQPNFEIVVSNGRLKHKHCMFFDRFAEKLVDDDNVVIYKLSFKSMVSALEADFKIDEIIQYLEENKKNKIPENVLMELVRWKGESKKIKVRTITVVETDDKYLLEELKSYKGIKKFIRSDLDNVFEISEKDTKKVKKEIEKKNHFCIID